MDDNYNSEQCFVEALFIKVILFDNSENVTIWGFLPGETIQDLIPCDFVCKFDILTDLLLNANEDGEKIIKAIAEKLSKELEIPTAIEMEELFGITAVLIDNIVAEAERVGELDENGKWKDPDDLCYYIESLRSKDDYFKKNKEQLKTAEELLHNCFTILNNAFKYYQQLIDKDFSEKEARKRAGLENELLFRIAYLRNKMI